MTFAFWFLAAGGVFEIRSYVVIQGFVKRFSILLVFIHLLILMITVLSYNYHYLHRCHCRDDYFDVLHLHIIQR
jgi:hypothetical protein